MSTAKSVTRLLRAWRYDLDEARSPGVSSHFRTLLGNEAHRETNGDAAIVRQTEYLQVSVVGRCSRP